MLARYANGRSANADAVEVELGAEALTIHAADGALAWPYAELWRSDDGNGRIILKRRPDSGERLLFERDAQSALRAAAPRLFHASARGVEGRWTVGGVIAVAWSLAAAFILGVPLAADPIAAAMPAKYRNQISDISWSQVDAAMGTCEDSDAAERVLNDLAYRMMTAAHVRQRDDIWITIVHAPNIPNAFALPDDSIVITDSLIEHAEHPDEIAGVLAHEIAHIERNHVMKNVVKQMGAGIFFDVVVGGAGVGQALAIASVNLAGLTFTREDEAEADARGLDYLDAAGIDPGRLAGFFERMEQYSRKEGGANIPTMLSTHPASEARAAAARARARSGRTPSMSDADWQIVRQACGRGVTSTVSTTPPAPLPPPTAPRPTQAPPPSNSRQTPLQSGADTAPSNKPN